MYRKIFITAFWLVTWLLPIPVQSQEATQKNSFQRAVDLFERRRWADARLEFMRLREELPAERELERQQVEYYLALCAVELKNPDAEQVLLHFEQQHPGSLRTNDIRFALASFYCTKENYEEADHFFNQVDYASLDADNRTKYNMRRGYLAYSRGDYQEAYDYFKRVGEQSHYRDHATYYCAYIDYMQGNYSEARFGFEQLLESEDHHNSAPFYLLQIDFRQQNYTKVTSRGEELLPRLKGDRRRDLQLILAESWFHLGNYNKALSYIEGYHAAEGVPARSSRYIEGFSRYRLGNYEGAIESLKEVTGPKDALTQNAAYHLADSYLRIGNKPQAMRAFSMATDPELDETLAEDALYNYAKLQYELDEGLFNEAIHGLGRYLERYPKSERSEEIRSLLAAAYYNSEEYDAAYRAISQLPDPDNDLRAAQQKIAYFRALKCYERGELNEAERTLQESAEIGISARYTSLATFWLGEIAFSKGNYSQAATHYNNYLARAPKSEREYAITHYNLGYCHLQNGAYHAAEQSFGEFLRLYVPEDDYRADALNREGDSRYAQRKFAEALSSYENAYETRRTARHYAAWQRALTLGILDRPNEKIEALKRIIELNAGDYVDEATYELGRTYITRSQYKEGAKVLKEYIDLYPNSPNYLAALSDLGMVSSNLGQTKQALNYYDQVITQAPTSAEARTALQNVREIYLARGDANGYFAYAARHGASSDLTERSRDSLSFSAAQRLYLEGKYDDATLSLRSYIKSFPSGSYLTDAHYFLSNCYHQSGDSAQEISSLKELADRGRHQYTLEVLQRLAPMAMQLPDYTLAADTYRKLYDVASTAPERQSAANGYVEATIATQEAARITTMALWVENCREISDKSLRVARHAYATQLRSTGQYDSAMKLYEQLARSEVHSAEGGEAKYRLIEARYDAGDWKHCEEMIFEFSEQPAPNNYWLAKSYLLLGDLYHKQGDAFQARATWQSVADGYSPANDGIVDEALNRISNLTE